MKKGNKHSWDPPKWLNKPVATTACFHDEEVDVYEGVAKISGIHLWRENYRTLLDLDQLEKLRGENAGKPTDDEIIEHIFHEGLHKISDLSRSIKLNGIRVPLILSYRKDLLDGNRRFLACKYLAKKGAESKPKFTEVPVKCVDPKISADVRLKIIAEMNFLDPHKEKWPREVRAKFAIQEFQVALKKLKDEEKAYDYINKYLEIKPSDLKRFQAVTDMIDEYIAFEGEGKGESARQEAERYGRAKFHFFEEFYNKALSGRNAIQDHDLILKSKELLFQYIGKQQILSTINVRSFASIVRYAPARKLLEKKSGSFMAAKAMYDVYAGPKKTSQKIIRFCQWLENLSEDDKDSLSKELKKRLHQAALNVKK